MLDLKTRKYNAIEQIMQLDESALLKLENTLKEILEEKSISIEQYNEELKEAETSIEKGDYLSHLEALKEISSWKKK